MSYGAGYKLFSNPEKVLKGRALGELPSPKGVVSRTFKMAWPSILDSFLAAIVGLIDMKMVSGLGTYAISAVGLTAQPKFIIFSFFIAMNVAITAVVARRYGQGKKEEANLALNQALLISSLASMVLTFFAFTYAREFMLFAGAESDTITDATLYFKAVILSTFFFAITVNINSGQRGVGRTKLTMITNVTANLVNLLFNYLLIEGKLGFMRLEVLGAGIATSIGYFVAFIIAIISVLKKNSYLRLSIKKLFAFSKNTFRPLMKVFSSAFIEQVCIRAGFLIFAIIVARLGTVAFATHQIVMNLVTITFSIGEGLSLASSALVGQTLGQERSDLSEVYTKCCQRIGVFLGLICILIFVFGGKSIISLFDKSNQIVTVGYHILMIAVPVLIFQISQVIYNGALRGAGDVKYVAIVMLISVTIFRPLGSYVFAFVLDLSLYGIWVGFLLDQTIRFIMSFARFKKGIWKNKKV